MDCEELRPLSIAFMGYNSVLTERFIRQFCEDNQRNVFSHSEKRVILNDGTRIVPVCPSRVWRGLDGYRFDQLILADDERKMIYETYSREISFIACHYLLHSWVPPEFQILYYNPFEEEPHPTQRSVFIKIGISADDAAKAFARMSEAARNVSTELEIISIRKNPSLSRFEKWILIRKLYQGEKKARKP